MLEIGIAAKVTKKSEESVKNAILNAIKENRNALLRRNKFFEFFGFVFDELTTSNINESSLAVLDGSTIFDSFLTELGANPNQYIQEYMVALYEESVLDKVFPEQLISAITVKL